MDLPPSPVSPQLSETVKALISARTKHNTDHQSDKVAGGAETMHENVQQTRTQTTGTGFSTYDQLNMKSSSDPDHRKRDGVGLLHKRLARSIDLNCMRIRKTLQNESSPPLMESQLNNVDTHDKKKTMFTAFEVKPIPCLSFHHPLDEKDVPEKEEIKNEGAAKTPTKKPVMKEIVYQPRLIMASIEAEKVPTERKPVVDYHYQHQQQQQHHQRERERIESLGDIGNDVPTSEVESPAMKIETPVTVTKPTSTVLTVNGLEYNVMRELGQGGSSRVFEVYNEKRQLLAIKCVNLSCADKSVRDGYLNEIKMLQQLQGKSRIIKLFEHEYNRRDKRLYVVMERGDVDLATFINQRSKREGITPEMIKFYWSEMLRAVREIHSAGIIHSDLKPANFLLVAGQLKLIDFGIASAIPDDKTSIIKDNKCGTPSYMSPEALDDIRDCSSENGEENSSGVKIKLGVKSDVWSLGCILYHMVYGRTPFQHVRNNLKLQAITNPAFKIDFPPINDRLLLDVLKCCIVRDVKQRASVEELLKHPFLTASTFLDCLNELSPSSMAKVSKVFEQFQMKRT